MKSILKFGGGILSLVLTYFVSYLVFGATTVVATIDGQALAGAEVFIDDELAGYTPFHTYLGLGHHTVVVKPPERVSAQETHFTWQVFVTVRGGNLDAAFESPPETVQMPVVCRIDGEEVGDCAIAVDGTFTGKSPFTVLIPALGEHEVRVQPPQGVQTAQGTIFWKLDKGSIGPQNLVADFTLR